MHLSSWESSALLVLVVPLELPTSSPSHLPDPGFFPPTIGSVPQSPPQVQSHPGGSLPLPHENPGRLGFVPPTPSINQNADGIRASRLSLGYPPPNLGPSSPITYQKVVNFINQVIFPRRLILFPVENPKPTFYWIFAFCQTSSSLLST